MPDITPEQLAASGSEDGHQLAIMQWCALNLNMYPELKWLHHSPNGGFRVKREAAKLKAIIVGLKAQGVKSYDIHMRPELTNYKGDQALLDSVRDEVYGTTTDDSDYTASQGKDTSLSTSRDAYQGTGDTEYKASQGLTETTKPSEFKPVTGLEVFASKPFFSILAISERILLVSPDWISLMRSFFSYFGKPCIKWKTPPPIPPPIPLINISVA